MKAFPPANRCTTRRRNILTFFNSENSNRTCVTDSEMPQERVGGLTTVLKSWQMLGAQKLAVIARSFFRSDERSSTNARDGQIIVPHG